MPWSIILVGGCFLLFGVLERWWACNPGQPRFFTRELPDDILYYFLNVLFYAGLSGVIVKLLVTWGYGPGAPQALKAVQAGWGALAHLPLLLQAALVLLVTDICQYWLHRAFHGRWLWPLHAVHHGPEHVDWTTTFRVHPLNYLLYTTSVGVLVALMGFKPIVFVMIAPANFVHAALVHANLKWDFGPFRYVLASPVFHRWHHSDDLKVRDKNFAPTFPFLDLMFGTFYMPKGELPQSYGVEGVPTNFLGQMAYPFRPLGALVMRALKPRLGSPRARSAKVGTGFATRTRSDV